jgi:alginate O-acetyltransferase complex protein AlgI
MIIFLVSGFWHGANWTFIVWGAIHGVIMIIERLTGITARDKVAESASKSDTLSKDEASWVQLSLDKAASGTLSENNSVDKIGKITNGKKISDHLIIFIRRIITFIIVDIAWVFFRADSLSDAITFIKQMFIPDNIMPDAAFYNSFGLNDFAFATRHLNIFVPLLFAVAFAMVFFGKNIYETKYKPTLLTAILTAVLFLASFICLGNAADFIYFKF